MALLQVQQGVALRAVLPVLEVQIALERRALLRASLQAQQGVALRAQRVL